MRHFRRHANGFAKGWMRVDGLADVDSVRTHLDGQGDLANHVACVGAHHAAAQDLRDARRRTRHERGQGRRKLLSGLPKTVAGATVNRFCAAGITAVSIAADRIRVGEAEVMIAGGVESMSMVPWAAPSLRSTLLW